MAGDALIRLESVGFEYAAVADAGIRDVNLGVAPGELVVLCGPSGSGKSTVARVVNALAPQFFAGALAGRVEVAGLDVEQTPVAAVARVVGSVFQDPRTQFFTGDTVSELAFGPENLAWPPSRIERRIHEVSDSLALRGLLGRGILALSGGEKQRLACAVASMIDPPVLVLDEPSSTLDAVAAASLTGAMAAWKRAGKAILVAEHRLDYLAGIADRFVYLAAGRVVHDFTRDQFLALGPGRWREMGLRSPRPSVQGGTRPEAPAGAEATSTLRDVLVRRGGRAVLGIGRADLPMGAPLAVVGANGSGKSTLARWLAGLGPVGRGTAELEGRLLKRRLDDCYLVAQDTNDQLFTETVLGEVALGAAPGSDARDILRALDLDALRDRHPRTLSGGEMQRLVIAVALASGRHIVILDEPTSGLDATHMRLVADAIRTLHDRGQAVIVVTHDADLIELTCGAAVTVSDGRLGQPFHLDAAGLRRVQAALAPRF